MRKRSIPESTTWSVIRSQVTTYTALSTSRVMVRASVTASTGGQLILALHAWHHAKHRAAAESLDLFGRTHAIIEPFEKDDQPDDQHHRCRTDNDED
ncbi:MAG: hypothetical protein FD153_1152 [Rhodospirillaceae bacterium]|nr:MAG: hypothetical protein FD153_1152 [Rhodospirillaceae bacterium]